MFGERRRPIRTVSDGSGLSSRALLRKLPWHFKNLISVLLSIKKVTATERMEGVQSSIVTTTIITIGADLKGIFHLENGHSWTLMDLHMREQATEKAQRRPTKTMSVFRYYSLLIFVSLAWNCSRTTTLQVKEERFVKSYTCRSRFSFRLNNICLYMLYMLYFFVFLYGFIWSARVLLQNC